MNSLTLICLVRTPLAESVARLLRASLVTAKFEKFSDSESDVQLQDPEQFRGLDVYIFQSTGMPVNDTVLGIAFLAQELKQAGAKKVILVNPYFGYSRQDKSSIEGKPGHVEVIAKLYEASAIDELISVELHNPHIKTFFSIPVHELMVTDIIAEHIKWQFGTVKDLCLIAPDKGAYERVAKIALAVGAGVLVFNKERYATDKTRVLGVTGTCTGKTAILIDDIIDTAGTAVTTAHALSQMGFTQIIGYFVHPVLSGEALDRIERSQFTQLFVSNTLPISADSRKIATFDISGLLAEFIWKMR